MQCDNPILIGGSGSTGSTLLATILNRHPEIGIGPELSLFNKPVLFNIPFTEFRDNLVHYLSVGTSTRGWHLYLPTMNRIEQYGWDNNSLLYLAKKSTNARDFIDGFFGNYLNVNNKIIWGEKTPSNSYQFDSFLRLYPKARIIHIVRDARDVVCSLKNRGMDSYYASMLWLYNTAMGVRLNNNESYYQISYEDLVINTENTVINLCEFLNVNYFSNMINHQQSSIDNSIKSWNNKPSGIINSKSVGKYKNVLGDFDYFVMNHIRISNSHVSYYGLRNNSIISLSNLSNIDNYTLSYSKVLRSYFIIRLVLLFMKDVIRRFFIMLLIDRDLYPIPGGIDIKGSLK